MDHGTPGMNIYHWKTQPECINLPMSACLQPAHIHKRVVIGFSCMDPFVNGFEQVAHGFVIVKNVTSMCGGNLILRPGGHYEGNQSNKPQHHTTAIIIKKNLLDTFSFFIYNNLIKVKRRERTYISSHKFSLSVSFSFCFYKQIFT